MRRKKYLRALSVMLCFCLLITVCPSMPGAAVVYAAGEGTSDNPWLCGPGGSDSVTATLSNGTLIISGTGEMQNYDKGTEVPWYNSRTSITGVEIGDQVTSIGDSVFYGCSGLTSVTIPNSVASIGNNAFNGCGALTSIEIPVSVTSIGVQAFLNCSSLTEITIPAGVTTIGTNPFGGCSGLTRITVDGGNGKYKSENNAIIMTGEDTLVAGCKSTTIPKGVTSIGNYAFYGCSELSSIEIPDSVTSIGSYAFYGCRGLTSVTIPDSVTNIWSSAFHGCSGLTNVTIPDSVTSIRSSAFYGCSGLTSVTIPDKVTSIGSSVFYGCSGLTSVTIPDKVTSIGGSAFAGCSKLTSVTIPDKVTSIGSSAFASCSRLTSIEISAGVTSIGSSAFFQCTSLKKVTMKGVNPPTLGTDAFFNCLSVKGNTKGIYVPAGAVEAYKGAAVWKSYEANITGIVGSGTCGNNVTWTLTDDGTLTISGKGTMQDYATSEDVPWKDSTDSIKSVKVEPGVTSIGNYAFYGCSELSSIEIPDSVTSIGSDAFHGCRGLTSVTIPDKVTSIGESVFYGCRGLTSVTIPDKVTSIGSHAFNGCSELSSIEIPDSVTSIGSYAFYDCKGLTSVTIPDKVTSIGSYAFYGCRGLTSVTIPDKVTSIRESVFYNCSGLTSVTIPDSVTNIGRTAFNGCSKLTSVTIPDKVTSLGEYVFSSCRSLTSIEIPAGVTSIGSSAFYSCTGLKKVTMKGVTPPTLGGNAFYGCSCVGGNTKGIYVPVGTEEAYKGAKGWKNYETHITDGTPKITKHPENKTVQDGETAEFSVTAEGEKTLSYQWQVKKTSETSFTDIQGATSPTYTISAVGKDCDRNQYQCVVTNGMGTATSEPATLTVTYGVTYNYGTNGGTSVQGTSSEPIAEGETIDLSPTAAKDGWKFVGWNTDKDAKTGLDSLTMGDSDVTLYAIYSKTLNASFYSGNKEQTPETVSVTIYNNEESGSITLPSLNNWAGDSHTYTADGWKHESSDSLLAAGDSFTLSKDEAFYGRYKRTVTLSFDANGGEGSESGITGDRYATVKGSEIDYSADEVTLPNGNNLSWDGYIFSGWAQGSAEGAVVAGGASVPVPEEDTAYYAKWTVNTYTVTFDYQSATGGNTTKTKEVTHGSAYGDLPVPERDGYIFEGWYTEASGGDKVTADTTVSKTGPHTLYAHWTVTYTVTLSSGEGYTIEAVDDSASPVNYGGSYTFRVKVAPGYDASGMKVMVNGSEVSLKGTKEYTMQNITENKEVTVTGVADTEAPGITLTMADKTWISLLDSLSFNLFYKENQTVTITAADQGSGVKKVWYYLADEGMTAEGVKQITGWQEYNASFPISEEKNYVIYVKAEDGAGNISYANSEGFVLDQTAPKIEIAGITSEGVCCEDAKVTVTEKNLKEIIQNGASVTLGSDNSFTLAEKGEQTITVTDKAGNVSRKQVAVSAHDWSGSWDVKNEPAATEDGVEETACTHGCGAKMLRTIPAAGDGEVWSGVITSDGVKIVGCSGSDMAVEVPSEIGGKSVTAIGEGAFADCTGLTTIMIPEGLDTTKAGIIDTAAKITYRVDENGKIIITSVTPGTDRDGGKKPVTIPDTIGGKKPEITDAVKEAMKNIPHEHRGGTTTCIQKAVCEICGGEYGDFAGHTLPKQWTVEKEATESESGRQYKIREKCAAKLYRITDPLGIPAYPNAEKIEKEVGVLPGAPDTVLNNSKEELVQSVLTPEEIAEIGSGTDAKIWLEIAPDVNITESEKEQVQRAAEESVGDGAEVAYFDLSLFKQVGNGEKTIIHEPGKPVSVTIVIPEEIRNKDVLMVRNYQIIRLHEGKTDIIDGTYKEESAEFTFETDKFSTYAICYKDSPKQAELGTPAPGTALPTPGGTAEPGTPAPGTTLPTPEMPSKEGQTKNELTLNANIKVSQSGRKIKVSWGRISGADGYDVYVQYCGKKFTHKSITAIKSGKTTKVTVKKVNGKPLNLKKNYKIYVLAYKLADGKKITLGKTITAHIVGRKNTKYTNVKAVKVKKSSYRLKKGRTAQIKAKTVLVSPGKKQLTNAHAKQFRYATTNKKVAAVSKKGKIKAVEKGTCTIYVYARNGYAKKIKVTVK